MEYGLNSTSILLIVLILSTLVGLFLSFFYCHRHRKMSDSEKKYQTLINNLNVGVYRNTGGEKGEFLEANPAMAKMFGYGSVEKFMKIPVSKLYQHPQERKLFVDEVLQNGFVKDKQLQLLKKDGTFIWCSCTAKIHYDKHGKIEWIDGVIEDITDRKNAEQEITRAYNMTRDILEKSPFGIFVVNECGNIEYANPAMMKISGDSREQFQNLNVFQLPTYKKIGLDQKIKEAFDYKEFCYSNVEYTSYYAKKTTIRNIIGIPLEEEVMKVLIFVEDITRLKEIEKELNKAKHHLEEQVDMRTKELHNTVQQLEIAYKDLEELNTLKSDFISIVSHELRTPLTSIKAAASILKKHDIQQISADKKKLELLNIILNNTDRQIRMVNDLLDVSKIEAGVMEIYREKIDLISLVQDVMKTFQFAIKNKKMEQKLIYSDESFVCVVDKDKIRRVFNNLIDNAIKYSDEKGVLEVKIEKQDSIILITISDTGAGISRKNMDKLFDRFQRFNDQNKEIKTGFGLGLTIVKGLVEVHGGTIWAESIEGEGTSFYFTIPV